MKILLIDQDLETLEKVQTSLTRAGYQVIVAADGDAGLRLARTERPDLIILDILLTSLEGIELCQQLHQDKTTKKIPRFIITSLTIPARNEPWRPAQQAKWQLLRYDGYLPKPIDYTHLVRKVDKLLKPDTTDPTGPTVFLVTEDVAQLAAFQQMLTASDFNVSSYSDINQALPAIFTYLPISLVIDSSFVENDAVWHAITRFQERHTTFNLIVLQSERHPIFPERRNRIDQVLNKPVHPWQIVSAIQKTSAYRNLEARVEMLSQRVLGLNWELSDTKQTLQYQNQELDLVNRQLRQLNDLKETLTGMLVHDLKAPLSAIMGALQFLTMDPNNTISENSQRILNGGIAAGQQMLRMTHTLLDEQKLENNQLVFDIEPTNVTEPVETSVEMLSPLLNMHQVDVEIVIADDLPPVLADPIILQRIIENLLDNAIKYSPADEIITIRAVRDDKFAQISIADRGDGIPDEFRDRVFERFVQLPDEDSGKVRGSVGLGLAFCKLAVATMGGKIWVDSPNNIGTTFFFILPLVEETEAPD